MGIYLFEEGYLKTDFGRGAAISILMLLIVAVLSVFYVRKMVRMGEAAGPRSTASRRRGAGAAAALGLGRGRDRCSSLVIAFPVYWMVATAFKPDDEIDSLNPTLVPAARDAPALPRRDRTAPFFWDGVKNSLIVVASRSRSRWCSRSSPRSRSRSSASPAASSSSSLMIGIQMLPQAGLIIPLYVVLARYHQVNALTGVIVTYMTFVLPFSVWTLRGFLLGIPKELEEAAMVDGSSRLGAFMRILLPLVAPGLVATSIFAFITTWNEYIFARILLNDQSKQTADRLALVLHRDEPEHGLGRR